VILYIDECGHKDYINSFEDQSGSSKAEMEDYSRRSPKPSFSLLKKKIC
jgi:hypothetical protein